MFARSMASAWAVLLFSTFLCAQGSPAGHWEAVLPANNSEIGVTLDMARGAQSRWIASMGVPSENATGLVVMDIAVDDSSVNFTAVELQMAKLKLILGPDGIMKGTISGPQGPVPIEFKRTGEAKVELIPASPALAKEFEGDWEGSLQMPNRAFRIAFHFKNQPDNTVAATIDTPDTNAIGLPLNNVKQAGREIEFGVRVAHARFQGTLNQAGTEITGQFSHGETGMPLTLRKK